MKTYIKPTRVTDLREDGRVILAHGEVTGHAHEVSIAETTTFVDDTLPPAEFFEEPDGRRVLLVNRPCVLTHQEHGYIALDPDNPTQVRQGDVLLTPIGRGAWHVQRQREYEPAGIRQIAD